MNEIRFEWDNAKASLNQKKHKVTFDEAKTVFYDEFAVQFFDSDQASSEDRFVMLGLSSKLRILVVCHCERERSSIIRIVLARKATNKEAKYYWEERS